MVANKLQHQHRQIVRRGSLVDLGISLEHGDRRTPDERCPRTLRAHQRAPHWLTPHRPSTYRRQSISRLTVASCRSSTRSMVDLYGAEASINASVPSQRGECTFSKQSQRINAPRQASWPGLGGGTPRLICNRFACCDQLALFSSLIGLLLDHLTGRRASACAANALQRLQILDTPSTLMGPRASWHHESASRAKQLLLRKDVDSEIRGKTLDQFRPQHFRDESAHPWWRWPPW